MDIHINNISHLLVEESKIIYSDKDRYVHNSENTIILIPSLLKECSSIDELTQNFKKRLKRPGGRVTAAQYCSLAICVLCSVGYTINHTVLKYVSSNDMESIWGLIETASISSSPGLRRWIDKCRDDRSQEGYKREFDNIIYTRNNVLSDKSYEHHNTPVMISSITARKLFGDNSNVLNAAKADMTMLLALRYVSNEDSSSVSSGPAFQCKDSRSMS
jgi:hypothetical protein